MADIGFLNTMNRSQRRAAANGLRGVSKCLECDLFGTCYIETQKVLDIRAKHKGIGLLPKEARSLPAETCEYHENHNTKGRYYPKYTNNT